ncbi:hypothetical protein NAP1_00145 [Erythrobacter sp. NAP1]|uniref:hypothetical protein n=1 Tax=Erythrobacter sp. NAP1 TaxID=237727 RepID=UPI0000686F5E|nr:hypothetical protein [Erythrobacter sp. NAP1]EAQ29135.1 hypothetical protein NAP1_00145 [Erythrobacter sp. NAP1]
MLRNVIGALVGSQVTKQVPIAGGTAGALLGSAIPFALKRMSLPTMLAVGAGGYFLKKYRDDKRARESEVQIAGTSIDGESMDALPETKPARKTKSKAKSTSRSRKADMAGSPPAPLVNGGGIGMPTVPTN